MSPADFTDIPVTHVLYLHGFRSSPLSFKAQALARWVERHRPGTHWWCPALPPSPRQSCDQIAAGTAAWPLESTLVFGSSLGGFYATWLAQQRGFRAVLLNPAIDPARDLSHHIGSHPLWHDPSQQLYFAPEFVDELRALQFGPLKHPERLLAVLGTDDEVLSFAEMQNAYARCPQWVVQGGDHGLSGFESMIDDIAAQVGWRI